MSNNNQFWGKRSGSYESTKFPAHAMPVGNVFRQMQWGCGPSNNRKQHHSKLVNVPRKWFNVNYKSKR